MTSVASLSGAATPPPTSGAPDRRQEPSASELRHDWAVEEVQSLHDLPLFELLDRARTVHRRWHPGSQVQLCKLLSVKTGGCPEDCAYCPQSAHHQTGLQRQALLSVADVVKSASEAREQGATRFCMGAAWRGVRNGPEFDRVVEMVRAVKGLGLEACATLGMLDAEQAERLRDAGLDAYNHNLDTSESFYRSIITTRAQSERLQTLANVRAAGLQVCSGGIIGMGESLADRAAMLVALAELDPHPESVPINALVRVSGTPLEKLPPVEPQELVRMIATARIVLPSARVRLSAGRKELDRSSQLMCLYAGANSIFYGDRLLTTPNPEAPDDLQLISQAGLSIEPPRP